MSFKTTGKVLVINPAVTGTSAKGDWKKQSFVIETAEEQFPKKICFDLFNDKNDTFSKVKVGSDIDVSFSVESREYNGKWFSNVNAFRVDVVGATPQKPEPQRQEIVPPAFGEDKDDLPF